MRWLPAFATLILGTLGPGLLPAAGQELPPPPRPVEAGVLPELLGEDIEAEQPQREADGPGLDDPSFEPRYVLEKIVVYGNHKTREHRILSMLGLETGDVVTATDPRVRRARMRLLALGYFLDVRPSLSRGRSRGRAVLRIDVVERGTIVVRDLFLGSSKTTALWGGMDVAENNFLGRGMQLSGAFVGSTTPTVPHADPAAALRLGVAGRPSPAWSSLLSAEILASRGSEFFRAFGSPDDQDPFKQVATTTRRIGGRVGISAELTPATRLGVGARFEHLSAELPPTVIRDLGQGRFSPIDFGIMSGSSHLATIQFSLETDTRSSPILPRRGRHVLLSMETSGPFVASDYSFSRTALHLSEHLPVGGANSIGLHAFAGAIFGAAPYFDRFFVGDLNMLLPQRALGLNFATRPSYNILGNDIARHRYDSYAARLMIDFTMPLWRRSGFFYGGDAFVAVGIFGLASEDDLRRRTTGVYQAAPVDLVANAGLRMDTAIGVFNISVANAMGRLPF